MYVLILWPSIVIIKRQALVAFAGLNYKLHISTTSNNELHDIILGGVIV